MSHAHRLIAVSALSVASLALVTPASAAPTKGLAFQVTCPGAGTFDVVSAPGDGAFTPVFGAGHSVYVPYDVQGTVTADGQVVDSFHDVKAAPVPSSAMTCTFSAAFTDNGASITVTGTAVVVARGA